MKEATGELNMSVVVISTVALLVAFFYGVIWPMIDKGQEAQVNCSKAVCEPDPDPDDEGLVNCTYKDKNGNPQEIKCKYKG